MSAFSSSISSSSSATRAPRINFVVIACGKGGLGSGPGPKKSKQKKWVYPYYIRTLKQKAAYRKDTKRMQRDQNLENLGFHRCLICKELLERREGVQCSNESCTAYFHRDCVETWFSTSGKRKCPHCQLFFENLAEYFVRYSDFHFTLDQNFFDAQNLHIRLDGRNGVELYIVPLIRQGKTMGYYFLQFATYDFNADYSNDAGGTRITDAIGEEIRESLQHAANEAFTVEQACADLESVDAIHVTFNTQNDKSTNWEYVQGVAVMSRLASNLTMAGMQRDDNSDEDMDAEDIYDDNLLLNDFYYKNNSNDMCITGYALAGYIRAGGKIW